MKLKKSVPGQKEDRGKGGFDRFKEVFLNPCYRRMKYALTVLPAFFVAMVSPGCGRSGVPAPEKPTPECTISTNTC